MSRLHSGRSRRYLVFARLVVSDVFTSPSSNRNQTSVSCGKPLRSIVPSVATGWSSRSRCDSGKSVMSLPVPLLSRDNPPMLEIETPHGLARAEVERRRRPKGTLVLGHGAGGGIDAPDLLAAARAAAVLGWTVVRIEQPYRVAGRQAPAPAAQLDAAWIAVVAALRVRAPLVVGGRSSGARVACRTAAVVGASGVLCLAFPLQPPGKPEQSRLGELDAVAVRTLVVQGQRDPFGLPPAGPSRTVVVVRGDHGLKADLPAVEAAVAAFLTE